ncbi:Gonadotropin-releasing hormone receptor [Araneus ventricosus]|uniref:Gonadotropin-releasing hormone receptor n=1 Tax=Araneus ventricosus TaxID=182803 RepID=A0A4Y2D724_ARAVE|nr:Gonadotropin-releasing hormone receptor [Araneus ventricosus]
MERNRYQEKTNTIPLKKDDIAFFRKFFGNFYRQFSLNFNDFIANNNSRAPEVSLVSESDVRSTSDKDCFKRENFNNPEVSFLEETMSGSNLSSVAHNCTSNSTGLHSDLTHAPQFDNSTLTKGFVLSIIAIFSFVGNVSTLASIMRTRHIGSSTVYMLLAHLAIADLLVTLFCILAEGIWTLSVAWYGGNVLCKIVKFMQMFSLYLSTFVLVLIGFDRLSAIRFPMQRAHAKQHVRRGIACIWILSGIFSSPQVSKFAIYA